MPEKVAVERNLEVVPRSTLAQVDGRGWRRDRDRPFRRRRRPCARSTDDSWTVAGRTFRSRLIVGTGKYKDFAQNAAAVEASGAEIVTVAVRRVNVSDPNAPMLTDFIDPKKITYLPNTAGCFDADSGDPHAAAGARGGGLGPGQARGAGRGEDALSRHESRRCARPRCWPRRASSRWSIASTIRSRRSSWRMPARSRSCRWARRSGRGSASRTAVTIRLIVEGAERAGAGRCRGRHRVRCGGGDGAGLRRRADEHRDRRGEGPDHDGARR